LLGLLFTEEDRLPRPFETKVLGIAVVVDQIDVTEGALSFSWWQHAGWEYRERLRYRVGRGDRIMAKSGVLC